MTRAELRELIAAAAPGPWRAVEDPGAEDCVECGEHGTAEAAMIAYGAPAATIGVAVVLTDDRDDANAGVIVAARNALPALLDALDAAEEALASARRVMYHAGTDASCDACMAQQQVDAALAKIREVAP